MHQTHTQSRTQVKLEHVPSRGGGQTLVPDRQEAKQTAILAAGNKKGKLGTADEIRLAATEFEQKHVPPT